MNIQSISIVVPTKKCVNHCKCCVSCMHDSPYVDDFDPIQYRKRIKYAANNGVNTLILTADNGEVLQNTPFLRKLSEVLDAEHHPFPNVEIQTTGVLLMNHTLMNKVVNDVETGEKVKMYSYIPLLKKLGVNTISLSVFDVTSSENNWNIVDSPSAQRPSLSTLTAFIKENKFNLRISVNMINIYDKMSPESILRSCKSLGADQVTFRKLYHANDNSDQTKWTKENACNNSVFSKLEEYIAGEKWTNIAEWDFRKNPHGKSLYRLSFGAMAYSIMGMSTVIDDNCMSKEENEKLKYVILRENGKLYCQWDDEGSLIF